MNGNIIFLAGDANATEIMRLSKEGITVNPEIPADETAKKVIEILGNHIQHIVDIAIKAERESCAELAENIVSNKGYVQASYVARAIRARGEK